MARPHLVARSTAERPAQRRDADGCGISGEGGGSAALVSQYCRLTHVARHLGDVGQCEGELGGLEDELDVNVNAVDKRGRKAKDGKEKSKGRGAK